MSSQAEAKLAKVKLRLIRFMDTNEFNDFGVLANIYPIPGGKKDKRKGQRDVILFAGGNAQFVEIKLKPGRYLLEVILPSGETISEELALTLGENPDITLKGDDSPHEWLSMQHFLGNVSRAPRIKTADLRSPQKPRKRKKKGVLRNRTSSSEMSFISHSLTRVVSDEVGRNPIPQLPTFVMELGTLPRSLKENSQTWSEWQTPEQHLLAPLIQATPNNKDERWQSFRIDPGNFKGIFSQKYNQYTQNLRPARPIMVARFEQKTVTGFLPMPWFNVELERPVVIEVAVDKEVSDIHLAIEDPMLGSMLGYMSSGALTSAAPFAKRAKDLLKEKVANPLGAATGAYVLLATEMDKEKKNWHQWIKNLMNWFPWISDGAILHGWHLINHQKSDADVEDAKHSFMEAYRRGIPYLTIGIQWLLRGLALFEHDPNYATDNEHETIQSMMRDIRRFSKNLNIKQPFITLERNEPDS